MTDSGSGFADLGWGGQLVGQALGVDGAVDRGLDQGGVEAVAVAGAQGALVEAGGDGVVGRAGRRFDGLLLAQVHDGQVDGDGAQQQHDEHGGRHQDEHAAPFEAATSGLVADPPPPWRSGPVVQHVAWPARPER